MPPLTRIIPALVHIQAHLDQDLSLDALAGHVGLSKYHFHELFHSATGETPKEYVDRLRLEWAAVQLRIRRVKVVDVAMECGYRNHETFSRAFRGRFLMSPSEYRKHWFRLDQDTRRARFQRAPDEAPCGALSTTRIVRLSPMTVAFKRHLLLLALRCANVQPSAGHRLTQDIRPFRWLAMSEPSACRRQAEGESNGYHRAAGHRDLPDDAGGRARRARARGDRHSRRNARPLRWPC